MLVRWVFGIRSVGWCMAVVVEHPRCSGRTVISRPRPTQDRNHCWNVFPCETWGREWQHMHYNLLLFIAKDKGYVFIYLYLVFRIIDLDWVNRFLYSVVMLEESCWSVKRDVYRTDNGRIWFFNPRILALCH